MTRRQRVEAWALRAGFGLFGILPLNAASAFGGWLARMVGPRLRAHRIARRNLTRALPGLTPAQVDAALRGMWDNLGRVAAESPHLPALRLGFGHTELVGREHVEAALAAGRPVIFFSAHFGNWEILGPVAAQVGLPTVQVYRAANNPGAEAVIEAMRGDLGGRRVPKGAKAARSILAALKQGESLAMLVDQKMNDGIAVPFFGRPAMTAPALAELALRHGLAVIPAHVERLAGTRFRVIAEAPLVFDDTGDHPADVAAAMGRVNRILEGWIAARPDLWFWVHRRWPD
ncbi:MAG: lysophospholipid acyltransferase family protein [Ferrovibrionaceae bacterium]